MTKKNELSDNPIGHILKDFLDDIHVEISTSERLDSINIDTLEFNNDIINVLDKHGLVADIINIDIDPEELIIKTHAVKFKDKSRLIIISRNPPSH